MTSTKTEVSTQQKKRHSWQQVLLGGVILYAALMFALINKAHAGPYNFPAYSLPELHIFKNDGIPTHEKYVCINRTKCHQMLNTIKYRYPKLSCATKAFIKDGRGNFIRIK